MSRLIDAKYDAHAGPKWNYARAKVEVEPAGFFQLTYEKGLEKKLTYMAYLAGGIAQVLQTKRVRVHIREIIDHPVNSNPMAFRVLGTKIGKKILKGG